MLHVSLREVVDAREERGDLDGGSRAGAPDLRVDLAVVNRRGR